LDVIKPVAHEFQPAPNLLWINQANWDDVLLGKQKRLCVRSHLSAVVVLSETICLQQYDQIGKSTINAKIAQCHERLPVRYKVAAIAKYLYRVVPVQVVLEQRIFHYRAYKLWQSVVR